MNDNNMKYPGFAGLSADTRASYASNKKLAENYPLLVHAPQVSKIKMERSREFEKEMNKLNINVEKFISRIKFTENGNLLIYCNSPESYSLLLGKKKILNGDVKELWSANEEKCIIIRGLNFNDLDGEVFESIKSTNGLDKCENLSSVRSNTNINMVKVFCNSLIIAEKLCKTGIIIGFERYKVVKFIRKPRVNICLTVVLLTILLKIAKMLKSVLYVAVLNIERRNVIIKVNQ